MKTTVSLLFLTMTRTKNVSATEFTSDAGTFYKILVPSRLPTTNIAEYSTRAIPITCNGRN